MPSPIVFLFVALAIATSGEYVRSEPPFHLKNLDALEKSLRQGDHRLETTDSLEVLAVRGEFESAQVLIKAREDLAAVRFRIHSDPKNPAPAPQVTAGFLGFVPIRNGTSETEPHDLIALAPTELPDPILEEATISVAKGNNQPLWLTVEVPRDCPPARYAYSVEVSASGVTQDIPLHVEVVPVTLPAEQSLLVSNWVYLDAVQKAHGLERWSEAFWQKLEEYAAFLSAYGQNVIFTPIFELIGVQEMGEGQYTFDFANFDRWVELFQRAGLARRIEGSHLATRESWEAPSFRGLSLIIRDERGNPVYRQFPDAHGEEYTNLLSQLLPALQNHLEERGWLDRYLQHVSDEPIESSIENYLNLMTNLRRFAPKLRATDATAVLDAFSATDVPVVSLEQVDKHFDFIMGHKADGKEVWFYTCINPRGPFLNRLIDFHLIRTRLLHWINFHYDLPGYGHWAANFWPENPLEQVEVFDSQPPLPPGDTHIMYPGKNRLLSSIRLEAMRDGIEDHELLRLLAKKEPETASALAANVVRNGSDYVRETGEFRNFRRQLIRALSEEPKAASH